MIAGIEIEKLTPYGTDGRLFRTDVSANAGAWLIFQLKRSDHITDALVSLHWLRVPEHIQYKIAILTYKVLHRTAPRYLGPLDRVADLHSRRALRSASSSRQLGIQRSWTSDLE